LRKLKGEMEDEEADSEGLRAGMEELMEVSFPHDFLVGRGAGRLGWPYRGMKS